MAQQFSKGDVVIWVSGAHGGTGSLGVVTRYSTNGGVDVAWIAPTQKLLACAAERDNPNWLNEGWSEHVFEKVGHIK